MLNAIVSVSNKTGLDVLMRSLMKVIPDLTVYSTGGTYNHLKSVVPELRLYQVESLTNFPEILSGRVKTLHPAVFGGILADPLMEGHSSDLARHNIKPINLVVVNLYPFKETINRPGVTMEEAVENIDIGGVSLLRASAKNFKNVTVLTNPDDYSDYIEVVTNRVPGVSDAFRRSMAIKAFNHTTRYDGMITSYLSDGDIISRVYDKRLSLKYGCNPHQDKSGVWSCDDMDLPLRVLNGCPSYINFLDAMNGWQLVKEIKDTLGLVAVASYKHTSPAGVGTNAVPIKYHPLFNNDLLPSGSPLATAFLRARSADPLSSFGDFIACNDIVDYSTAKLIGREVSDGIIAPGYTVDALDILKKKKNGGYLVFQIDSSYTNKSEMETRECFGMMVSQRPNDYVPVVESDTLPSEITRDLTIANITLKYTQSNSIVYAKDGQVIGVGAGQQNRVDCVRLAGRKALNWHKIWNLDLPKFSGEKRQDKVNEMMKYVSNVEVFDTKDFGFCLASDAFFPYRDSIDVAKEHGVGYIVQPGGSIADPSIVSACDEYGIKMLTTGHRLFTH